MKILDGKSKLDYDLYNSFFTGLKDDNYVYVFYGTSEKDTDKILEYPKLSFTNEFFNSKSLPYFNDKQIITLYGNDIVLEINKSDLETYSEKHKIKHNKLILSENEIFEKETVTVNIPYYYRVIACCVCEKGKLSNFETKIIKTSEEDVLVEINKMMTNHYKEVDKGTIRFNLKYKDGDENYSYKWKSINELVNEGVFNLA